MFKVGDKVTALAVPEDRDESPGFTEGMEDLIGQTGIVTHASPYDVTVKYPDDYWAYRPSWLSRVFEVGDLVTCPEMPTDRQIQQDKQGIVFTPYMQVLIGKPGKVEKVSSNTILVKYDRAWSYLRHWLVPVEQAGSNHHVGESVTFLGGSQTMFTLGSTGKTTDGKDYEVVKCFDAPDGLCLAVLVGNKGVGFSTQILTSDGKQTRTQGAASMLQPPTGNINVPAAKTAKVGDTGKTSDDADTWKVLGVSVGDFPLLVILNEGKANETLVRAKADGTIRNYARASLFKPVARKIGFVNIYPVSKKIHPSRVVADDKADDNRIACVKISYADGQYDV